MPAALTSAATLRRLQRGDVLRMELGEGGARLYWFESPLAYVSAAVVDALQAPPAPRVVLVEAGDSLFGLRGNSQSWMAARGSTH